MELLIQPQEMYHWIVPDTKCDMLVSIIWKHIPCGVTVYTDGAEMYECLSYTGYTHQTFIHSEETENGVHTNNIEKSLGEC